MPDEVTINMLEAEVEKNPQAKGFIFDGFPRTQAQAQSLDDFLSRKEMSISATIALEADDDELVTRLLKKEGNQAVAQTIKTKKRFAIDFKSTIKKLLL